MYYKKAIKKIIRSLIPLSIRKRLAVWINHQSWLGSDRSTWWSQELIRDLAEKDIKEYHKFLWSNHLGYAETYEVALRFGYENMKESRKMFFCDLNNHLIEVGIQPRRDIMSVFEVGCSLGYQLRYMETDLFSSATDLEGIDIDEYSIETGTEYLRSVGSKIRLICGDMESLGRFMKNKIYDIIVCSGVLMYVDEDAAVQVVDTMMRHTRIMAAFTGLAHPDIDNFRLQHSITRHSDGAFIHNIDSMVKKVGGKIISRRWEGGEMIDGHTIYFIFAKKF